MKLEEAKEILENVMADEVIGTYCTEIQKTTECGKNCENEDCFLQQAIDTVIAELHAMQNLLDEKNEELEHLQKEKAEYEARWNNIAHELRIFKNECVSKSKIREKIEEIKFRMNDDCIALHEFQREAKIEVLQDLLKEE